MSTRPELDVLSISYAHHTRWHTKGYTVVYCTLNPATALLETLVHIEIDSEDRPERFPCIERRRPGVVIYRKDPARFFISG